MTTQTLVSTKYQVVIPKEVRKRLLIKAGDRMNIAVAGEQIILVKPKTPKKLNWPDDYYKKLKGLWKPGEIEKYLEEERNSWD